MLYCFVLEWNNFQTAAGYMHPLGDIRVTDPDTFSPSDISPDLPDLWKPRFHGISLSRVFSSLNVGMHSKKKKRKKKKRKVRAWYFVIHFLNSVCIQESIGSLSNIFVRNGTLINICDVTWNDYQLTWFVISNFEWCIVCTDWHLTWLEIIRNKYWSIKFIISNVE